MATDFDRWLDDVETQIQGLSLEQIDHRIAKLRRDVRVAQVKVGILMQLRERVAPPRSAAMAEEDARRQQVLSERRARAERQAISERDQRVVREGRASDREQRAISAERQAQVREQRSLVPRVSGIAVEGRAGRPQAAQGVARERVASEEPTVVAAERAIEASPALAGKAPSADRKRKAIIDVLREQPDRGWSPREIRTVLEGRGVITGEDEGTPTRLLLRRMVDQGLVQKIGQGQYGLATDSEPASPPSGV
jgi:hypothetical protein